MNVMSALRSFLRLNPSTLDNTVGGRLAFLSKLRGYYMQNGLYDTQASQDYYLNTWNESMKPLRDCAHRVVEFYVSKVEPGTPTTSMPIIAKNGRIVEPILQVWRWSNFDAQKSVIIREFAMYGDTFIKTEVNSDRTRVYHQYFPPSYVTDFKEDKRGNISYLRLDIPNGELTHTEIWTETGYAVYEHKYGVGVDKDYLGDPVEVNDLSAMGIDFIPFTHARFKDIGDNWGIGCFTHALEKIDEASRMATRLHEILFRYNKALWVASANDKDASGRPVPAPRLGSNGKLELEDDSIITMPGVSTLTSMVPDIKYADALAIMQDMMKEIERDLPELSYANLKEQGTLSGKAVRELMGDAIDKVIEARTNLEAAIVKADNHALTLGQVNQIPGFTGIGNYASGEFDHAFKPRDVIPVDEDERARTLTNLTSANVPLLTAMRLVGYPEETVKAAGEEVASAESRRVTNLAEGFMSFNRE
jgi:hypothetical protein